MNTYYGMCFTMMRSFDFQSMHMLQIRDSQHVSKTTTIDASVDESTHSFIYSFSNATVQLTISVTGTPFSLVHWALQPWNFCLSGVLWCQQPGGTVTEEKCSFALYLSFDNAQIGFLRGHCNGGVILSRNSRFVRINMNKKWLVFPRWFELKTFVFHI